MGWLLKMYTSSADQWLPIGMGPNLSWFDWINSKKGVPLANQIWSHIQF